MNLAVIMSTYIQNGSKTFRKYIFSMGTNFICNVSIIHIYF